MLLEDFITKFTDCESKKELRWGLQHVRDTDLHLKLIDLDPNGGIIILFFFIFDWKSS